jgi:hypothetical protein
MRVKQQVITDEQWQHARTIWDYHQMHHDLRRCDVAIGLGSHDLGVAQAAAERIAPDGSPCLSSPASPAPPLQPASPAARPSTTANTRSNFPYLHGGSRSGKCQ